MEQYAWTNELKEIIDIKSFFLIENQKIIKEIDSLVTAQNDEVAFLYTRRTLEVIITEICLDKLCRERGNEPLLSIIDKLHKDKAIPDFVHTAMQNLNKHATYGVHPKEFDPNQVRTAILELVTILKWYFKEKNYEKAEQKNSKPEKQNLNEKVIQKEISKKTVSSGKKNGPISIAAIAIIILIFILIRFYTPLFKKSISNADTTAHVTSKNAVTEVKPEKPDSQFKNKVSIKTSTIVTKDSIKQPGNILKPVTGTTVADKPDKQKTYIVQYSQKTKQEAIEDLFPKMTDSKLSFAERKKVSVQILNQFAKTGVVSKFIDNNLVDRVGIEDYLNRLLTLKGFTVKIKKKDTNTTGKITVLEVTEEKR
jgi:hypothetical protein